MRGLEGVSPQGPAYHGFRRGVVTPIPGFIDLPGQGITNPVLPLEEVSFRYNISRYNEWHRSAVNSIHMRRPPSRAGYYRIY